MHFHKLVVVLYLDAKVSCKLMLKTLIGVEPDCFWSRQENGNLSIFSSNPNRPSDFRCEISKQGPWHAYVLLRAEAWASHTLRSDEKKCGIRSVITKTETRGPYTRPFTVYFVHTKTAFKVKSVCKRFSDFKELDQKLKRQHSNFLTTFPPDQVFNSMAPEFVSERRKQLQTYLDEAMEIPNIATGAHFA